MNAKYKILDTGLTVITDKMDIESTSIGVWVGCWEFKRNFRSMWHCTYVRTYGISKVLQIEMQKK